MSEQSIPQDKIPSMERLTTLLPLDPLLIYLGCSLSNFTIDKDNRTITMSETPPSADSLLVTVNGIVQRATTDYTINNNILTFTVGLDADDIIVIKGLGYVAGNYTPQSSSIATSHLVGEFALQNDDTYNSAVTLGSASKNTAMVGPLTFNNTLTIGGVVTVI